MRLSTPVNPAGVLFDLDGTLLDTAPTFTACLNRLLAQHHRPLVTLEALRSTVSHGTNRMLEYGFGITKDDSAFAHHRHHFLKQYLDNIGSHTTLFPGVAPLLEAFNRHRLPWGIVTNKPQLYTHALLAHFKILQDAQCIISGDTLPTHKPHPAPLLAACEQLKLSPQDSWYIGDAKTDVQASQAAGLRSAIVYYGYIPEDEDPHSWQADCYFKHAHEIGTLFDF